MGSGVQQGDINGLGSPVSTRLIELEVRGQIELRVCQIDDRDDQSVHRPSFRFLRCLNVRCELNSECVEFIAQYFS